jgi:hypothetical protein
MERREKRGRMMIGSCKVQDGSAPVNDLGFCEVLFRVRP